MVDGKYKKKLDDLLIASRRNLRHVDESLISRAFSLSLEAHKHDIRASGEPFFNHPYEVAMIVAKEIPLDDVSVASALLHDVVEDTDFELKDIRAEFGDSVADIVDGATKISDIVKSREVTKAESYRKMLLSMINDIRVILVKFADRLHNMRTLEYLDEEKQIQLATETLEIYAPLAHRFGLGKIKWELEDLGFKYTNRVAYEELAKKLNARRKEREIYIGKFISPIENRLKEDGFVFEISGRPKHLYSIHNKMIQRNRSLDEIYDLFAIRINLDTENDNDCFAVYGIVSEIYIPIPERFKNYISLPKKNGYQSIHTTVIGPEGKMVEVQIRSKRMHEVAEKGVAAHWKYKENVSGSNETMDSWLNWVREIFDQGDAEPPTQFMESFKLNLFQDEIYIFTPKGDLKILPQGATPVDFAFEVHSEVGFHCIGAKVNGKIVTLDSKLKSGDQVEVITSKHQTPSRNWEQIVVTHKAKAEIRKWINEEKRQLVDQGKQTWEKKLKKSKLHVSEDEFAKFIHNLKFDNTQKFYLAIGSDEMSIDSLVDTLREKGKQAAKLAEGKDGEPVSVAHPANLVPDTRGLTGGVLFEGESQDLVHRYAKCCDPIPGDEIIGFITTGEGIRIHRRDCRNVRHILQDDEGVDPSLKNRIIAVSWPAFGEAEFIGGIKLAGEDRPGILNDISQAISTYMNTNIRSVNLHSKDSLFTGSITLYVRDLDHLTRLMDKVRRVKGVSHVERF
jgi:RelA/SpoT family (p)ppGpp synthetase